MPSSADASRARQVEIILDQIQALPTLSPVAARLLTLGSADSVEISEIVKLLESDPALSARIIGLCRRSDRGLAESISTVRRAVVMLGIEAVRASVLSVSVYEMMSTASPKGQSPAEASAAPEQSSFNKRGFWKHMVAVACAAQLLAQGAPALRIIPEEAFAAGLLHDLGKLALQLVLPQAYERVIALAETRQSDAASAERTVLGLDHHTAGKRLAEQWGLPGALRDAMWFHGQPAASVPELPHRTLIQLVTAAKAICRRLHLGWSGEFSVPAAPDAALRALGLPADAADTVAAPLHKAVADRCALLGLDDAPSERVLLDAIGAANTQLSRMNLALQERSRFALQQSRVLAAIQSFQARPHESNRRSVQETLADVAESAASLLGAGFYALLYQRDVQGVDEPWRLVQFGPDTARAGHLHQLRMDTIEPPPGRDGGARSLAPLTDPAALSVATLGLLPWLSDALADAADLRRIRLIALTPPGNSPAAVLMHDREPGDLRTMQPLMPAITATWGAAITASIQREQADRLTDSLAEATRSLAEAQARLTEAETMARLGEMTASAAHEMNNPLTILSGRGELLLSRLEDPRDRAAAGAIVAAAHDLSDLISSLHLVFAPPRPSPGEIPTQELLDRAIELSQARAGVPVQVRARISEQARRVWLDKELIGRALAELIANAAQAAPEQHIDISVEIEGADDRLLICVQDQGPGMSPRALSRAFDPFFSELAAGRRRGLGLTNARRLAETHGGGIELESTPGRGTRATLWVAGWRGPSCERHDGADRQAA